MADDPRSFEHALFLTKRAQFLAAFEQFLVSMSTPLEARRHEAMETEDQVSAIVDRLKAMRVI
jgi:hypothetical protein